MIGSRLTDATGEYEVTGVQADGRLVLQRVDEFEPPAALAPGEIAERFNVEVTVPAATASDGDGVEAFPGEQRGWQQLAQAQHDAQQQRKRPTDEPTPEEAFAEAAR